MSDRKRKLTLLLVASFFSIAMVATSLRICMEPLDVSGTVALPAQVHRIKNSDDLAYSAHVVLGALLEGLGCDPTATALQWFKAAAHAQTQREIERAAQGISAASQRSPSASVLEAEFCSDVAKGQAGPRQAAAIAAAGFHC